MLILLTILVVLSAAVLIAVFRVKRRNSNLLEEYPSKNLIAEDFRPLFEPDENEIRAFERDEKKQLKAKTDEEKRLLSIQKAEKVREFREFWEMSPTRRNTVQLLHLAAESESGKIYSETAEKIISLWQADEIEDLTADNLAHILESHFWLLPNEERTPGVSFWLKQEIAGLRSLSVGKN